MTTTKTGAVPMTGYCTMTAYGYHVFKK